MRARDPVAVRFQLLDLLAGFLRTQALHTAARLGVADIVGEDPTPVEVIAERVGADPSALRRVMRLLASSGVFSEPTPGAFARRRALLGGATVNVFAPGGVPSPRSATRPLRWPQNDQAPRGQGARVGREALLARHGLAIGGSANLPPPWRVWQGDALVPIAGFWPISRERSPSGAVGTRRRLSRSAIRTCAPRGF